MVTRLRRTVDRKTKFYPTQKNTFGLLPGPPDQGGSCPRCTRGEGGCWCDQNGSPVCYAATCCRIYKAAAKILKDNQEVVKGENVVGNLLQMLSDFQRENCRYAARNKTDADKFQYFRWHWSGDLFDTQYAEDVAKAIKLTHGIKHWIYTRSFDFAQMLRDLPNVVVYLSLDLCNWQEGMAHYFRTGLFRNPRIKVCFMAKTKDHVKAMLLVLKERPEIFGDSEAVKDWVDNTNISTCPVDDHKMSLEYGCSKCRQCISKGNQLLWFRS